MVADVEPGARARAVAAGSDDRRRVAQVAGPLARGDQHGAGSVHLDRAVRAAKRLDHVRRLEVLLAGQRPAAESARVARGELALRDGDGSQVLRVLTGLGEEALRPHCDVHEVRAVADRVAVLPAAAGELHAAHPRAGPPLHRPVDQTASA